MSDLLARAVAAIEARAEVDAPDIGEIRRRARRRRRRHALGAGAVVVATVAALTVAVSRPTTSGVKSRQLDQSTTVPGPQSEIPRADRWLPQPTPAAFKLIGVTGGLSAAPAPAFIAVSNDQTQVVTVGVESRVLSDDVAFTDPVRVAGHDGTVSTGPYGADVEVALQWTPTEIVHISAIGMSESAVEALAATLKLPDARPMPAIEMTLPAIFEPFVRSDHSDVKTVLLYGTELPGTDAHFEISTAPEIALARLNALVGPLHPTTVDGRSALVGSRSDRSGHGLTVVAAESDGRMVTVVVDEWPDLIDDMVRLAIAVGPADQGTWIAAMARIEPGSAPSGPEPCALATTPTDATQVVTISAGAIGDVEFFAEPTSGTSSAVCVRWPGSRAQLDQDALDTVAVHSVTGSSSAYGLVDANVATVRIELQDHTTVTADTYPVPGYQDRVWLASFASAPRYRAIEQLDPAGNTVLRLGRP